MYASSLHSPFPLEPVPGDQALMVHAGKIVKGWNDRGLRDIECLYCEALSHSTLMCIAFFFFFFPANLLVVSTFYKATEKQHFSLRQFSVMHKIIGYFK